jgi:hypothetical protein
LPRPLRGDEAVDQREQLFEPQGPVGTHVTVSGQHFSGARWFRLGNATPANLVVVDDSTITFDVPATATAGAHGFGLIGPGGLSVSAMKFTVQ